MSLIAVLFMLVTNQPSYALFCQSIEQIDQNRQDCEDNDKVAKAADACVTVFQAKVAAEQAKLQKLLSNTVKSSGISHQDQSQDVNEKVLSETISRVDLLIAEGLATRGEIASYIDDLLLPFVWSAELGDRPKKFDPDTQKLFDQEYCYGEHKEVIEDQIKGMDQMISELRAAKTAAAGLEALSGKFESRLQGGAGQSTLLKGQAHPGSPTPKVGNSKTRDSDVTGIKEDEEKRAKDKK
jgi:hypothetical protein